MPRWRLALISGVAVSAVTVGVGYACGLPEGFGYDRDRRVSVSADDSWSPEEFVPKEGPTRRAEQPDRRKDVQSRDAERKRPKRAHSEDEGTRQEHRKPVQTRPTPEAPPKSDEQPRPPVDAPKPPDDGGEAGGGTAADEIIRLVNQERARAGCRPLVKNDKLTRAAQKYSDVMARTGHFDHIGLDGSQLSDRVEAEGYEWSELAENISRYGSVEETVNGWMGSPGHRQNILNCGLRDIGVGVNTTNNGPWWVQNFGTSR